MLKENSPIAAIMYDTSVIYSKHVRQLWVVLAVQIITTLVSFKTTLIVLLELKQEPYVVK